MTRHPGFNLLSIAAVIFAGAIILRADTPASKPAAAAAATSQPATTQSATAAPDPRIEAAILALSADSWKERQNAQDTLVSFGDDAAPRLRKLADNSDDEEVRTRAGAALRQIEENALTGPSTLTLHFTDAKPEAVFNEIARQARTEFPTFPPTLWQQNVNPLSVNLERANFWIAFKEVCQKTGIYPQQNGNDRRMTLQQSPGTTLFNGPSVISGPFLIVANRIYRSNSVDLANPGNVQHDFNIALSAFAEPKLRVIQSSYYVNVDEAMDEKGNSLVNNERVYSSMNSGQQWMWNLSARLNYPEGAGKTISRFKGSMKFLIQTKSETLDVPNILTVKNLTKTVARRRMLIKEVKQNGEQYDVSMTIYRDGMPQDQWNALQNPGYTVHLVDKDGRNLTSSGWGGGSNDAEMNYTWNFNRNVWNGQQTKLGEPHRLVWEIPTETREINAAFEFKDLPLP
jgi:hypothetical protein